jgi:hypothetical protein
MQRLFIQCLNVALLVLIFIGLPAATRAQLGHWHVSSGESSSRLMFWGLVLVVGGNTIAALGLVKSRKERKLCGQWAGIFTALLLVQFAFNRGYINFDWLKQSLLWLQKRFQETGAA